MEEEKDIKTKEIIKSKLRQLIVETDGSNVNIIKTELSVLELREVGRLLMNLK